MSECPWWDLASCPRTRNDEKIRKDLHHTLHHNGFEYILKNVNGGLISESFSLWLKSSQKCAYHEHFLFWWIVVWYIFWEIWANMKNFLRLSHLLSSPRISDDFRQGKPDGLEIYSKFFPHSSRIPLMSVFSAEFRPECKVQTYQSAICFFLFVCFNFFNQKFHIEAGINRNPQEIIPLTKPACFA